MRVIRDECRFGVYVDGEWLDLGRATLAVTRQHEESRYPVMEWVPESMLPEK